MLSFEEFVKKYTGVLVDYDGNYGGQCVDLYRQYLKDCFGITKAPAVVGAKDIWDQPPQGFEKITNTPEGIPNAGDIMIWKATSNNPYGHVGIVVNAAASSFNSFDQNFPSGSLPRVIRHTYTNVIGWLRFISIEIKMSKLSLPVTISTRGKYNASVDYMNMYEVGKAKAWASLGGNRFEAELEGDIEVVDEKKPLEDKIKKLTDENGELVNQKNALVEQNEELTRTRDQAIMSLAREGEKVITLQGELKEIKASEKAWMDSANEKEDAIKKLEEENKTLRNSVQNMLDNANEDRKTIETLKDEKDELKNEIVELKKIKSKTLIDYIMDLFHGITKS